MFPPAAIAFIGGAGGFCLLLLIFFLYITKKACFSGAKGCICCKDDTTSANNENESDSEDSEDEIKDIYRKSMRRKNSRRPQGLKASPLPNGGSPLQGGCKQNGGYSPLPHEDPHEIGVEEAYPISPTPDYGSTNQLRAQSRTSNAPILRPASIAPSARSPDARSVSVTPSVALSVALPAAAAVVASPGVSISGSGDGDLVQLRPSSETRPKSVQSAAKRSRGNSPATVEPLEGIEESVSPQAVDVPLQMSGDEFDVSDLQPEEEQRVVSKCGNLLVQFTYVVTGNNGAMSVTIHQGRDIPDKNRGGASSCQVHMVLLPTKQQRFKTKSQPSSRPNFEETFTFKGIPPQDVNDMGVRLRIYGKESLRRERLVGECIVTFASLNLDNESSTLWITMEPRLNLNADVSGVDADQSDSEFGAAISHGVVPELYIGLAYSGTTGRLSVEVIKGSHFKNFGQGRPPDTYVKCSLMASDGSPIAHSKSTVRRGQPNPLFKETFMFQVALFQLPEMSLMVSVYNKKSMKIKKKEMIGWFSLGFNSSGDEEKGHWEDMITSGGEQVARWHALLEN